MARKRRFRLTLVELLLTIAVVGILSTVLLPVFAQERDRARQAVCLANVRTIAQALRMYLADTDGRLPPVEYNPEVLAYFNTYPGGGGKDQWNPSHFPNCHRARQSNPYLRWPVILDPYLPSREVWRCPDARLEGGAAFINGAKDWAGHLQDHEGEWGTPTLPYVCPRLGSFPAGWGGEVTDTFAQGGRLPVPRADRGRPASPGMFLQSIAANEIAVEKTPHVNQVSDPAWLVVLADGGWSVAAFGTGTLAYPDLCHLECASDMPVDSAHWQADWENCPWSRQCGAIADMKRNPALRKPYARHFGGVNLGFLDGHARWMHSEKVIEESPSWGNPQRGRLRGYEPWGSTLDARGHATADPYIVPLY